MSVCESPSSLAGRPETRPGLTPPSLFIPGNAPILSFLRLASVTVSQDSEMMMLDSRPHCHLRSLLLLREWLRLGLNDDLTQPGSVGHSLVVTLVRVLPRRARAARPGPVVPNRLTVPVQGMRQAGEHCPLIAGLRLHLGSAVAVRRSPQAGPRPRSGG